MGHNSFMPSIKVLLADDESINRELLKGVFKESDMIIYEAKNGSEAIELIKEHNPKVALLDLKMPVIGGMEVAQFIKSSDKFASIKTIGISTTPENYLSDERKIFLDDFISKPVNLSELLKKLSNFLPYENINKHDEFNKGDNRAKKLFEKKTWDKLKIELKNRLLSISHTSSFTDFEDFALLLIEKGNKYDYDELVKIGNRIFEASTCFDLETVQHQLYEFNVLVNKSKSEINDKSI